MRQFDHMINKLIILSVYSESLSFIALNFDSFSSLFETFEYCDAKVDYDKFCDIMKKNEKRKALSKFLMICVEYDIIELEKMEKIMLDFIKKINLYIDQKENENALDEIAANLVIMIQSSVSSFKLMKSHTYKQVIWPGPKQGVAGI